MQLSDLIFAVCAAEAEAAILTLDSDFLRFPGARDSRAYLIASARTAAARSSSASVL